MKVPRILLTAAASGSGKTLITCGILQALQGRGIRPVSFKCGPDYIDPMFHARVLGTMSGNLDTFFTGEETTRYLLADNFERAKDQGAQIALIEGVMGYYDGLGGISDRASAYDVARVTQTPAVLIVNCKGMSLSVLAQIKGFLSYRPKSCIQGVILNRLSPMLYPRLKELIQTELGITPLGYVPQWDDLSLESRHLGLVLPREVADLQAKLRTFGQELERTLDLDALLKLADEAPPLHISPPRELTELAHLCPDGPEPVVAVARDEAFCFLYRDNLALLQAFGAKLVYFSPIRDDHLPTCDGLLLPGGYPELHLPALSANERMRREIKAALLKQRLPTLAECGGFMYLMETMEDMQGNSYPVAGVLSGRAYRTRRLGRFGYITLKCASDAVNQSPLLAGIDSLRGHEFHYFDTTSNGEGMQAVKPMGTRSWQCMHVTDNLLAGFPHLHYYSNPMLAFNFLRACRRFAGQSRGR